MINLLTKMFRSSRAAISISCKNKLCIICVSHDGGAVNFDSFHHISQHIPSHIHSQTHTHIKINKDEYCGPCKKKFNMHRINFKTIETKRAFDTKEKKILKNYPKKRLRGMREEQGILIKISTVTKSLGQM